MKHDSTKFIQDEVRRLAPGQHVEVCCSVFQAYDGMALWIGTPFMGPDRVLEGIVGSSYEYGYEHNLQMHTVTFFRLAAPLTNGCRSYVSPDRRHLYVKGDRCYIPSNT